MSKVDIKDRLKEALIKRQMTQSELAEKAHIDKGQLSSYISGKYKPRQKNIDALSIALNVNEAWLMGFNAPMDRDTYEDQNIITFEVKSETAQELLTEAGFKLSISNDDIITITTQNNNIICSLYEYELVNIYDFLTKQDELSAQALIREASLRGGNKEEMEWLRDAYSVAAGTAIEGLYSAFGDRDVNHFKEYIQLTNQNKILVSKYTEKLLSIQNMEHEAELNAAHARTDINIPEGTDTSDDDIMDDENF